MHSAHRSGRRDAKCTVRRELCIAPVKQSPKLSKFIPGLAASVGASLRALLSPLPQLLYIIQTSLSFHMESVELAKLILHPLANVSSLTTTLVTPANIILSACMSFRFHI